MGFDQRVYWGWMQNAFGAGSKKPFYIYNRFSGGLQEFHEGGPILWDALGYITEGEISTLISMGLEAAEVNLELNERLGHKVISLESKEYPETLKNIIDPPALLYLKGKLPDVDRLPAIAMVGTRTSSEEGENAATTIAYQLALNGVIVVSGGAKGIDTAAHRGTMKGGGVTICVLACGISDRYLQSNDRLRADVANTGLLLSEYPFHTKVSQGTFRVRNRLISGLCCGTLVVEASEKSGALITANHALNQNRDVFVYPGSKGKASFAGGKALIEAGAKAVTTSEMILEEYKDRFPTLFRLKGTPEQEEILQDLVKDIHAKGMIHAYKGPLDMEWEEEEPLPEPVCVRHTEDPETEIRPEKKGRGADGKKKNKGKTTAEKAAEIEASVDLPARIRPVVEIGELKKKKTTAAAIPKATPKATPEAMPKAMPKKKNGTAGIDATPESNREKMGQPEKRSRRVSEAKRESRYNAGRRMSGIEAENHGEEERVAEELGLPARTMNHRAILSELSHGFRTLDELEEACGLTYPEILADLSLLELKGLIAAMPGGRYRLL